MPKANKKTKKSKLLNWLRPGSPRKNILLFVLAFAVVGGGYMLYSSFAAGTLPLVYSTNTYNDQTLTSTQQINKVNVDGTGLTSLSNTSWSSAGAGSGTVTTDGKYSPNHNQVAWTTSPNPNTSQTGSVWIKNLGAAGTKSSPSTKSITMPAGESDGNVPVPLTWYPDSIQLAVETWNANAHTASVWNLNTSTSKFTLITKLPADSFGNATLTSMAVLGDNSSIVYSNGHSIILLAGGTAKTLYNPATSTFCGKVRSRPGTQKGFVYECSYTGATNSNGMANINDKILKQTTTTTPVAIYTMANTYTTGSIEKFTKDFALSPDGTQIALYYSSTYISDATNCTTSSSDLIATMDYSGKGLGGGGPDDRVQVTQPVSNSGCGGKGGGGPADTNSIVWSPDGLYFAYISPSNTGLLGGYLYTAPTNGYASYTTYVSYVSGSSPTGVTLIDTNVSNINW